MDGRMANLLRRIVSDYRRSDEDARGVSSMDCLIEEAEQLLGNTTPCCDDCEATRQLVKRMAHAIENVLEGAEPDDGIVSVHALCRLDELYEQDIRPLGPSRMPKVTAA